MYHKNYRHRPGNIYDHNVQNSPTIPRRSPFRHNIEVKHPNHNYNKDRNYGKVQVSKNIGFPRLIQHRYGNPSNERDVSHSHSHLTARQSGGSLATPFGLALAAASVIGILQVIGSTQSHCSSIVGGINPWALGKPCILL